MGSTLKSTREEFGPAQVCASPVTHNIDIVPRVDTHEFIFIFKKYIKDLNHKEKLIKKVQNHFLYNPSKEMVN